MNDWLVVRVRALADGRREVVVLAEADRSGPCLDRVRGMHCPDGCWLLVCRRQSLAEALERGPEGGGVGVG
jgi:hypothetical protein